MVPPRGDHPIHGHFWVPIDDENCWAYSFDYHPVRALTADERQAMKDGHGVHCENIPGTYRPVANKDNDYLMDREAQRRGETTPASRASRSRTPRCRRAWARSSTAPRSASSRPTPGSSRPARSCRKAVVALRDEGVDAPRRRPGAPPRPFRRCRAAAEGGVPRVLPGRRPRGARHAGGVGLIGDDRTAGDRSLSSWPVRATAAELAFRHRLSDRASRGVRVVALDAGAVDVVAAAAQEQWSSARFFVAERRPRASRGTSSCAASAGADRPR